MLSHYRVIDLCDGVSQFAGYLLATMGAEVIAVEPPAGSSTRHQGPFVDGEVGPEFSLLHWAYNQGKKSVALDLGQGEGGDSADGASGDYQQLRELVASADAVIVDANNGRAAISYEACAEINPAIVYASITPFGRSGPRANWVGSDLTAVAGSGFLHASGDADRPPVRVSGVPQSFLQAGGDAAAAVLIALHEAQRSGRGQQIDVAAMVSMTHGMIHNLALRSNANPISRLAGGLSISGVDIPMLFPCADGHTVCVSLMGAVFAPFSRRLVQWEDEEGFGNEELLGIDWENFGTQVLSGEVEVDVAIRAFGTHAEFLATKTKEELWAAAFDRNLLITPSATVADLITNEHFDDRSYWQDVAVSAGGAEGASNAGGGGGGSSERKARFAGHLAKFSEGQPESRGPVPKLGEHNDKVDLDRQPFATTTVNAAAATTTDSASPDPTATTPSPNPTATAPSPDPTAPNPDPNLPLAGLKVLEFSWVIATPSAVRILADYGATVVKVETETKPDTMRTVNPFVDEDPHPDNSVGYGTYNAGKRSISLDLSKPESREVVLDLIRWADVSTESFAPGAFERMGYSYEELSKVNPGLVMLSSTLLGQTGPFSGLAGYGFMAAAIAGFYEITGWADRGPAGPYGPYTDYLAPRVVVASIMSALEQRKQTGRGCHIDLSQTECALHYLSPAILDASVNGHLTSRVGNEDPAMSPHGVFASEGEDQWVAIACADEMWPALAGAIGRDDLAGLDQTVRRETATAESISEAVTAWTSARSNDAAATQLQAVGVDAYPVNDCQGCMDDPQLAHLSHHIEVPQNYQGTMWTHNCRTTMSRTPPQIWRGGPCLGEDNYEVLTQCLGYDGDKVADLVVAEVLT